MVTRYARLVSLLSLQILHMASVIHLTNVLLTSYTYELLNDIVSIEYKKMYQQVDRSRNYFLATNLKKIPLELIPKLGDFPFSGTRHVISEFNVM